MKNDPDTIYLAQFLKGRHTTMINL